MKMVGNQRPSIAGRVSVGKNITESFEKLIAVVVITKYPATIDTSDDDVVYRTRRVYACFTRHGA